MPDVYAIVQMPDVLKVLESAPPSLTQTILTLQTDPRPAGHQPADEYGDGYASLLFEKSIPPYTILYRVDEDTQRVVVMAVYEKRWR